MTTDEAAETPTGDQHLITRGDARAVVTELGAGLRAYQVGGVDILRGYSAEQQPPSGKGQVLVPWANRIDGGRYAFDGREHQLPLTEVAKQNAIHGLLRWVNWQVDEDGPHAVVGRYTLHPQPGYPFTLDVSARYALGDAGLTVRLGVRNVGTVPAPVGMGCHPYLAPGGESVDDVRVTAPAARYQPVDDRGIPSDPEPVDGTPYDLRAGRRLAGVTLDTPYTDLERDPDGRWRVRIERTDGRTVAVWGDETFTHLQLFTADSWSGGSPRSALAVEPMTCAPNAFVTGDGLVVLEPGEELAGAWGIEPG